MLMFWPLVIGTGLLIPLLLGLGVVALIGWAVPAFEYDY